MHSIGREMRKFCKSRLALVAVFFTAFYPPGYGPLEIFVFDGTELQTLVMPSGRRQRAVAEPLQDDDAIARSELGGRAIWDRRVRSGRRMIFSMLFSQALDDWRSRTAAI